VPGDATELTVAPLAPDPFAPVELDPEFFGTFTGDLFFDFPEFPPFRFLDLCADDGALPGCPPGVGGTVLAPLGHETLGDFRLGSAIRPVFDVRNNCGDFYPAEEDEHPIFVWANHPAVFEVTYHWTARPGSTETVTVSNADSDDPEFLRFADDSAEHRLASSAWPRECFLLTEIPVLPASGDSTLRGPYTVEVNATSFAGETASRTYSFHTGRGVRPPTYYWDRDDHNFDIQVPVKRGTQGSGVAIIHESAATTCADVEADGFHLLEVLPRDESGYMFYGLNEPIDTSPGGPYDRSYTSRDVIHVRDLEEGTAYLACIWWFESAERSFDSATVVEREMMWITTPNRLTASVVARSVDNFTARGLDADSYELGFSCASDPRTMTLPPTPMIVHEHVAIPGTPVLCDYASRQIGIPTIGHFVTPAGTRQTFALPLDPRSPRGFQAFEVELSTPEEPGPTVTFNAYFTEGSDSGFEDWGFGIPLVFEPLPEEPEELPTEIRIDTLASGVDPDGRDGLLVTATFDRPVQLSASLLGDPCLTGPEPSFTSDGLSVRHIFRLDGLCLLTRYSVVLEVEDRAGNTTSFADIAPGLPLHPGATYFAGTEWTDGYHVEYTVQAISSGTPGGAGLAHVSSFRATIDGLDLNLGGRRGCLEENFESERLIRRGTDVWGEEISLTASFGAEQGFRELRDGLVSCYPYADHRYRHWRASVTSTFTIAEFESGSITIEFPAPEISGIRGPISLSLIIRGEVTG
jgi:hypothetical protein